MENFLYTDTEIKLRLLVNFARSSKNKRIAKNKLTFDSTRIHCVSFPLEASEIDEEVLLVSFIYKKK